MSRVLLLRYVSKSLLCVPCTKIPLQICVKVSCVAIPFDVIDNILLAASCVPEHC